ncbi:helix-turn-helix transcriptional regulator [Microbispora sp. RL4-1S]|uniref:Helix-turn-helix transcriptional regulator n=1 Tax=Microbispora oryzae TaxID=2806554 RepID=A0A940WIA4_9ACTN|nr:helix-turn-helix transcriptional regulator [Microbispora oryzae]MBP2704477.1 helix-turn-helix transcriptional regulator [Microbispora oryzae]
MPPTRTTRQNGWAIRGVRAARGLSGYRLAKRLGIQPSTLTNIEREVKNVSTTLLGRIAAELETPIEAFDRESRPMRASTDGDEATAAAAEPDSLDGEEEA